MNDVTYTNETDTGQDISDSYVLVVADDELHALCHQWQHSAFLAMDTEFIRTSTFFPHVGLIQVNAGDGNYLIDPLTISDWAPFCALLVNPAIVKIFHSCSEDLQVFMAAMQLVPSPVFDTQIAAAILNEGFGNSYQALVMHYLNLDLPKEETRSDWLQRPLRDKQCHYAALDVACLPAIYQIQRDALEEQGRMEWLQEECALQIFQYHNELSEDFSRYYLNMRGAWQLDREQLNVLQKLAQWRELRARKRDKPRNWIIKDKQLIDIAKLCPVQLIQLQEIDDLGNSFLRHEGEELISLVSRAIEMPEDALPELLPKPLDGKAKSQLKRGQQFAEKKADELALPVEMLIRKRWLISLLQNARALESATDISAIEDAILPEELKGWRRELLLPGLVEAMR